MPKQTKEKVERKAFEIVAAENGYIIYAGCHYESIRNSERFVASTIDEVLTIVREQLEEVSV